MRAAAHRWRMRFIGLWAALAVLKLVLAARLPAFVDETFYWQEGRHLAWAYSDLPGLSAWLARLGTGLGGDHVLALRLPALALAALLPWLVVRIARREVDAVAGWQAGVLALLLPLAGSLGLLALPDVAMTLAALLCLDACTQLLRRVQTPACIELALGLAMGALSHYRFAAIIAVGGLALLLLPSGRAALRDPRTWLAIWVGVVAWMPLVHWNLAHADAGLRFQLVDRHPWTFSLQGAGLGAMQLLLATPLALAAMAVAAHRALRGGSEGQRLLAIAGTGLVVGFVLLGFFADRERVSFHWPLQGYLALLPLVPTVLARWRRGWRIATWATLAAGLAIVLGYYLIASVGPWRTALVGQKMHPVQFAGWDVLADAVREELAQMPAGTTVLAGDFKIGAQLGFALGDPRIAVLDHPLNAKHGRAPQLVLWGLHRDLRPAGPQLLVIAPGDVPFRELLAHYHRLCGQVGPLPPPRSVLAEQGHPRFLLFRLPAQPASGSCVTPAMAWIDVPASDTTTGRQFDVRGWAFKDGVGLRGVDVLLDGVVVAQAQYGEHSPGTAHFWRISTDPHHPAVGFSARVQASPGQHWLGLRLHGSDGSREDWPAQRVQVR